MLHYRNPRQRSRYAKAKNPKIAAQKTQTVEAKHEAVKTSVWQAKPVDQVCHNQVVDNDNQEKLQWKNITH